MLQNPEGTTLRQYQIIEPIQLVAEIYPMTPALTCKTRPAPSREEHPERWPSGLRRTLGKRVCGKPYRGFESHSLRHYSVLLCIRLFESTAKTTSSATKDVAASSAMLERMTGKLKPLDIERETRPGKYPDGDGLYLVAAR